MEAHGSFARAKCVSLSCGKEYSAEEVSGCRVQLVRGLKPTSSIEEDFVY